MAEVIETTTAVPSKGHTLKELLQKRITKEVDFMGEKVSIQKLTINEIIRLQDSEETQAAESLTTVDAKDSKGVKAGIKVTTTVIRAGWAAAIDWTDNELYDLPFEELLKLANEIMIFSGVASKAGESQ